MIGLYGDDVPKTAEVRCPATPHNSGMYSVAEHTNRPLPCVLISMRHHIILAYTALLSTLTHLRAVRSSAERQPTHSCLQQHAPLARH